jgi:hypothetical protein
VDNRISSAFAIVAGVLLTIASPPIVAQNPWVNLFDALGSQLTVLKAIAAVMLVLGTLGGLTICLGGYLCFKNHLRTGKELIGIGTGVGLADLLLLAQTGAIGAREWFGWGGLVLAVLAGRHIHGPEASYVGEIRRLFTGLRARLSGKDPKKLQRKHSRRAKVRRTRLSTGQDDLGRNKKREGQGPGEQD